MSEKRINRLGEVWANRLLADTKSWDDVPDGRKDDVKAELESRVKAELISEEVVAEIIGE